MTDRDITNAFNHIAKLHQVPVGPVYEEVFEIVGPHYVLQPYGAVRTYGFLIHGSNRCFNDNGCVYSEEAGYAFSGIDPHFVERLGTLARCQYLNVLAKLCKGNGIQHLVGGRGEMEIRGITPLNFFNWDKRGDQYLASEVKDHWKKNNPNIPFEHAFELLL